MAIQALSTPAAAPLPQQLPLGNVGQPPPQSDESDASGESSGITITRVDKQDYPDGYVVTTTHYANKATATASTPKAPPSLVTASFDPSNGGQLSALLAAQEQSQTAAQGLVAAGINPYAR